MLVGESLHWICFDLSDEICKHTKCFKVFQKPDAKHCNQKALGKDDVQGYLAEADTEIRQNLTRRLTQDLEIMPQERHTSCMYSMFHLFCLFVCLFQTIFDHSSSSNDQPDLDLSCHRAQEIPARVLWLFLIRLIQ